MGDQLAEPALAERIAGTAWRRVVAIRPTGWSFRPKGGTEVVRGQGAVTLLGIPYSEHSSFEELRCGGSGGGGCGCGSWGLVCLFGFFPGAVLRLRCVATLAVAALA